MGKQIQVGGLPVGGGAPVSIQSMTNTPTHEVEATGGPDPPAGGGRVPDCPVAVPNLGRGQGGGKDKEA